jgi:hypothetical protein
MSYRDISVALTRLLPFEERGIRCIVECKVCCANIESWALFSRDETIHGFHDEHMVVERSSWINHVSDSALSQLCRLANADERHDGGIPSPHTNPLMQPLLEEPNFRRLKIRLPIDLK